MKVRVKLFATLQRGRFKTSVQEYEEGITVAEVCRTLGISMNKVSIIFINNTHADHDRILQENDELALFPPIGGG
jgi:molybdopterin synthase sulfur carrier subunit